MRSLQEKIVIGAGLGLAVLPFTGFPRSWKSIITVVLGLALAYVGALLLKAARTRARAAAPEVRTGTFTEIRTE